MSDFSKVDTCIKKTHGVCLKMECRILLNTTFALEKIYVDFGVWSVGFCVDFFFRRKRHLDLSQMAHENPMLLFVIPAVVSNPGLR